MTILSDMFIVLSLTIPCQRYAFFQIRQARAVTIRSLYPFLARSMGIALLHPLKTNTIPLAAHIAHRRMRALAQLIEVKRLALNQQSTLKTVARL